MKTTSPTTARSVNGLSRLLANTDLWPVAAILTAVLLWGGSFSAMRVVVRELNPWSVMWGRMMVALILLLPLTVKLIPKNYRPGDWKLLLPTVVFQPCLYFLLESNALRFTTSSQAGVIAASVPLMVVVGAWLFLGESVTGRIVAGLILSLAGVFGLTLLEGSGGAAENPMLGNAMELGAMAAAAANMILVKQLCSRYNPWTLTGLQVAAGAIFFSPGLFFLPGWDSGVWSIDLILTMVFLGALVTLGAFGLYNWGMSRIPAGRASAFINLVPVTAVFFGWILLGESLNPLQCLAAGAVIVGVWLSQKSRSRA